MKEKLSLRSKLSFGIGAFGVYLKGYKLGDRTYRMIMAQLDAKRHASAEENNNETDTDA